jgi:twitching motility protein PilT
VSDKRFAPAGEQTDRWSTSSPIESKPGQTASEPGSALEAAALVADDDFVPPDIFGPASSADRSNPTVAPPGLAVEDADFVPADIFESSQPGGEAKAASASPSPETHVEPAAVETPQPAAPIRSVALPDEQVPISDRPVTVPKAERWQPPVTAPEGVKPFPVAPRIPPLPLPPPASRSKVKQPANAKAAVGASSSRQAPLQTKTPMIRTTSLRDPSGATQIPATIDDLLRLAASLGASRLYLSSNTPPSVRIGGVVQPLVSAPALAPSEVQTLLVSLALASQGSSRGTLALTQWSFELQDVASVRCLTFNDTRGPGAVFRIVPIDRVAEEPAGLSLDIQTLAVEREGLLIVAGPRESQKHALIGALVELVNRTRQAYVITVQRELSAPNRGEGSFVSQREARGLDDMLNVARTALQEDPDVLVLEEVRSAPLMSLAFDAAASGQLIIAGFTAASASAAVQRIVDLFPPEQSRQVQLSLAHHLRGVVGQVRLPKIEGGHVSARELLLNTPAVSSVLATGKAEHLAAAIAAGRPQGMIPLCDVLVDLVQNGVVAGADAYRQAPDPVGFVEELKRLGIDTSFVKRID